ncbi:MAG: hypothetical protein KA004_10490 [Verrucomicrobiales bacterium]|nr:hypothetical protein [Verrucomicrobiales bacterium]
MGEDLSIVDLARYVAASIGFTGQTLTDPSKPGGTPRKRLDVSRSHATGWRPRIRLREGLAKACREFLRTAAAQTLRT